MVRKYIYMMAWGSGFQMPNALCSATPTLLFDVALTAWRLQLWRRSRLVGTSDRNYTNLSIVRTTSCQRTPNIITISSTKIIFGGPKSWPSAAIQTLWLDTSCFGTLCRHVSDGEKPTCNRSRLDVGDSVMLHSGLHFLCAAFVRHSPQ